MQFGERFEISIFPGGSKLPGFTREKLLINVFDTYELVRVAPDGPLVYICQKPSRQIVSDWRPPPTDSVPPQQMGVRFFQACFWLIGWGWDMVVTKVDLKCIFRGFLESLRTIHHDVSVLWLP